MTTTPELPQEYKDQVLALVKSAAEGYADEVVEGLLAKSGEARSRKLELDLSALVAQSEYQKATGGFPVIGAVVYARAMTEMKGGSLDDNLVKAFAAAPGMQKTINLQDAEKGGILIQGEVLDLFFQPLRARTAVLSLNPVEVPLTRDSVTLTGWETDPSITWVGEPNTQEIVSEPTSGARQLTAKKAMVIVPITQDYLDAAPTTSILRSIEDGVRSAFAIGFDQKLIRGVGTQFSPKGLRHWAGDTTPANATLSLTNVLTDFAGVLSQLAGDNVRMERMGVIWAPRTEIALKMKVLEGTTNRPFFMDEMKGGTFLGMPFRSTTNVPVNLGGGGDESEVIVADFAQVVVGQGQQLELTYHAEGAYTVNGVLVSALERDEQLLKGRAKIDLVVPHTEAVHALTGVTWS